MVLRLVGWLFVVLGVGELLLVIYSSNYWMVNIGGLWNYWLYIRLHGLAFNGYILSQRPIFSFLTFRWIYLDTWFL